MPKFYGNVPTSSCVLSFLSNILLLSKKDKKRKVKLELKALNFKVLLKQGYFLF